MSSTHTIDSNLQLTEVLTSAMRGLKRKLLPLNQVGTVYGDVKLKGDGTMAIPYYPLATTGTSVTRAANGSRKALATNTSTGAKTISNFTNKVQAISFTANEVARQPLLNPVMHGMMKGEALAFDILADIFGGIRAADFSSTSIAAVTAANFDEDEVADIRKICSDEFWPEGNRSLILNPAYGCNLLKQPQIIDASMRGDGGRGFRDGVIGNVLGFDIVETAGLNSNNGTAISSITGVDSTDVITATAHGFAVGDRILFPTLTGGSGLTAATTAYFVKTVPSADTFTIAATAGGATVSLGSNITDGSVRLFENIGGIATTKSGLLVGFAPVPPTPAIRQQLFDYQELVDPETGLVLQYYHFADPDTDEEVQTIECHYGWGLGDTAQLKIIREL